MKKIFAVVLSFMMILSAMPKSAIEVFAAESGSVAAVTMEGEFKIGSKVRAKATNAENVVLQDVNYQWYIEYEDNWSDPFDTTIEVGAIKDATDVDYMIPTSAYVGNIPINTEDAKIFVEVTDKNGKKVKSQRSKAIVEPSYIAQVKDAERTSLPKEITQAVDISLPTKGFFGSDITWKSNNEAVISNAGVVQLPTATDVNVTLTGTFSKNGEDYKRDYNILVRAGSNTSAQDQARVEEAKQAINKSLRYIAKFGTDVTAQDVIKRALAAKGFGDVEVAFKSVGAGDESEVDAAGNILYVKKELGDGNNVIKPMDKWKQAVVNLEFKKNAAKTDVTTKINIYWDLNFLKNQLNLHIFDKLTDDMVRGVNPSLNQMTKPVEMPSHLKYENVDKYKAYASIIWKVEDETAGKIIETGGTLENGLNDSMYRFTPSRGAQDKKTKIIATVKFNFTNDEGEDAFVAALNKEFSITIPGTDPNNDEEINEMKRLLDNHFDLSLLLDKGVALYDDVEDTSPTYVPVDPQKVDTDLGFRKAFKNIPNSQDYKMTLEPISEEDKKIMVPVGPEEMQMAADIYRPLPGEGVKEVNFNVALKKRSSGTVVKKKFTIKVLPLTDEEIVAEKKLMAQLKLTIGDKLKGKNESISEIHQDLATPKEFNWKDKNYTDTYTAYHHKLTKYKGLYPDIVEKPDGDLGDHWYTFKSSNKAIIEHDTLRVTKPEYNTRVTITTVWNSRLYGRYEERYPNDERFKGLNRQMLKTGVTVIGHKGEDPNPDSKIRVKFRLHGADKKSAPTDPDKFRVWIEPKSIEVGKYETALDVARKAVIGTGYGLELIGGSWLKGVRRPDGIILNEKDNGERSGWMYRVNGEIPKDPQTNLGLLIDQYNVKEGDDIVIYYNNDYEKFEGLPETEPKDPEKAPVKYRFESITNHKDIPAEVTAVLPNEVLLEVGTTVSPADIDKKTIELTDGTWTFKGWDKESAELTKEGVTFVGKWSFKEKSQPKPVTWKMGTYIYHAGTEASLRTPKGEVRAKLKWKSMDPKKVVVKADRIKLLRPGTAEVKATYKHKTFVYMLKIRPKGVSNFRGKLKGRFVTLRWKPSEGMDGIFIYRADKKKGKYVYKTWLRVKGSKKTSAKLYIPKGKTYAYKIRAYKNMKGYDYVSKPTKALYYRSK